MMRSAMPDLRWFAENRYGTLPVAPLRRAGLSISLEGNAPCRAAVAIDSPSAVAAYRYARRHRCPLGLNIFDLPPWRLGEGRPDPIIDLGGRLFRIRRPRGGYPERSGYYSRLRHIARAATLVFGPSAQSVGDIERRFGISAERIPFCYDSDRFSDTGTPFLGHGSPLTPHRSPLTVLSISRLVPHKNHATILRAAARLDPRPRVCIIGQGPEAAALLALADRLQVALELRTDWVSDDGIVAAYRGADVVVSASRFEGFGLTPMEGLAMGLPVLASDIPTHREFLGDAVAYFAPDDDGALAAALDETRRRPPGRPSARSSVLEPLTIDSCAARLAPCLERLIAWA
jgi:glycosyltransferase involved in cell wall biosynthesis